MMRWKIIGCPHMQNIIVSSTRYSIVQKLSNKQSAKVIEGLIDLEQHTARDKETYEHWTPTHLIT